MADEIKLKAPTVEQQVVVNINGEEKLKSFADTLEKISNNKNLQKYWKTQQELINATTDAYNNFSKKASQDNAKELIKVTNALKAMAGTDLSGVLPDFDKIAKSMSDAQKVAGNIDSAFSVKGFKEAFDSFEMLKAYGVDIQNFFSHFGVSADVGQLQKNVRALEDEVGKLTRRLSNAKNANEELRNEFENFKSGSGFADKLDELDNLKSEMSYIREEAEETFRQFLKLNNVSEDGYDRDGFYDDNRFREYFQNIQSGYMSASDAIQQFKREYSYLLEESFKTNNDTFGLEQLQAFSNKLDSIFRQVEETSNKINDIISNGVLTKSVENLSVDSSLTDSQRSLFGNLLKDEESLKSITTLFQKLIEESNKTKTNELFNSEQLQQVLSIFDRIENSLSSLRSVISDVGDGEEFSPLLKMINNVQSAISELITSVKGIGLNMNIDVGSDSEMEAKVQSKIANALQAYQRLFEQIKMSGAGGSVINTNFFEFDINQYDTMMSKIQAYKKFIDNMRTEAKAQFNGKDILYQSVDKKYWTQASAAFGQVTKAFNEMNASSDTNPLKDLFGSGDLSEIVSQLGLIVAKLEEISTTASSFKEVFTNGFNVTASVEEIDKLTNRVKELEDELSKVKLNPVSVDKSNISSANETPKSIENTTNAITEQTNALKELILSWVEAQKVMSKSGSASTEKIAVGNLSNGFVSNSNFTGDLNSISDKLIRNIIENATETIDTIIHSHPDYNLAAFSPEDIASSIVRFATGIQNQIVVGMDEISIMDVSKIKDINPLEIKNKIEQELSSLINSYIKNQLQNIDNLQSIFTNNLSGGIDEWNTFTDLISENTNSDFLKNVIQKYKDSISDALINMGSDYKFSNSDELGTFIYENIIKKYVRSYVSNSNPDINQSEYDALQKEALENFKKEFSAIYDKAFSIKDYESLLTDNEIQPIVKEAFSNILKTFGLKYEDVIKTISIEQLKTSSISPMKDVFQGDKIDQATTSAKELDKTLEQVNIPADSFDEVLSKLDLTKSELKEIIKITKQSVSDSEGKFHDSYTLKDKLGSTEIYGLSSNTEKGQLLRSNIVGYDAKAEAQESKRLIEENIRLNKSYYDSKKQEEAEYQRLRAKYLAEGKAQEEKYYSDLKKSRESTLKSYQDQINSFDKQIPKKPIDGQRSDKFKGFVQDYKNAIEEARKYLDTLGDSPVTKEVKDEWERLIGVIKKAKEEMDAVPNAERGSDALSRGKEIDTITKYLNKFTGISKQAKRELNGLLDQLQSGDPSVNVKKIHERFLELTVAEREAGREARNLFDIFKDKKIYSFLGQAASMFSFYDIINVARQAGEAVIDLNTNITELAKVSEASASQIYDDFNSYADIAKEVGGTISDTISATADWSRNGYNIPDAKELAEVAMIYKNVGDGIDIDQANEYLISTLRGFSLEAKDAMDIIDSINEVANNEPISSAGIGEALQRSAAAFNVANTSLQESIALVTSTNSVLQSPEKVGSMWTTVSARIRGAKTELEDAGLETDGMVESTSKLQAMIKGMTGFDILEDDQKTFKSIYDIIIGIGEEFQNLSGVDQAALLEALAGGVILPENMETYLMNIFNCKVNLKLYATI